MTLSAYWLQVRVGEPHKRDAGGLFAPLGGGYVSYLVTSLSRLPGQQLVVRVVSGVRNILLVRTQSVNGFVEMEDWVVHEQLALRSLNK